MPKRLSRKKKQPTDPNVAAFQIVQRIAGESEKPRTLGNVVQMTHRKNPAAVALGRKGGHASAVARMEKMEPEERRRIASHAARQRWAKKRGDGG